MLVTALNHSTLKKQGSIQAESITAGPKVMGFKMGMSYCLYFYFLKLVNKQTIKSIYSLCKLFLFARLIQTNCFNVYIVCLFFLFVMCI